MDLKLDAIKDINFSDLTVDSIGSWPPVVRFASVFILGFVLLCIGLWTDTFTQVSRLKASKNQQIALKQQFEAKQEQAAGLNIYKSQLVEMNKIFSTLLKQLPGTAEVPGLLEDISKQGLESGLEFRSIKPMPEISKTFYVELPFEITGYGTYHQIATFLSKVSALSRIVTVGDFSITHSEDDKAKKDQEKSTSLKTINAEPTLDMKIIASTFRYLDNQVQK